MGKICKNINEIKELLPKERSITLVGGCFDLIHIGHIHLFEYASQVEDILIVAVLSDSYIKKYKGKNRPIINQDQRAKMVSSINGVDFVYITNTSTSSNETLSILQPQSVIFGEESSSKKSLSARIKNIKLSSPHTKIHLLPRYTKEDISTSGIIHKIKSEKYC